MKSIADLPKRRAVQKQVKNFAHGLRLFGDDYILFQRVIIAVSEHMLVGHADHALLEALADAPFAVFGNTPALLLRKGREERNHQLAAFVHRIDVLLFEAHLHAQPLQAAHRFQRVDGVARKAREAFGENQVDMPGFAFGQQPLEFVAADGLRAADAAIREHPGVFPARRALDQRTVIADLLVQRVQQAFRGNGYPGVGGDAPGTDERRRLRGRNFSYNSGHGAFLPSRLLLTLNGGKVKLYSAVIRTGRTARDGIRPAEGNAPARTPRR